MKKSYSTILQYRGEVVTISPNRIPPSTNINHTRKQKTPNTNLDDIKMTSNDIKVDSNDPEVLPFKSKNKLNGGASSEINENYLDEKLHNKNL